MTKRRRPNDITVYFNEEQPFDLIILSAIERIREGTVISKGSAAKRLLTLGTLVVGGVDARSFSASMRFDTTGERWRAEQRLRHVKADSQSNSTSDTTGDGSKTARVDLTRESSNEVTVFFNEQEQPFDSAILSAVRELREGTSLSKGSSAKRVMALGTLVLGAIDARPFIHAMKLGTVSERWGLERLLWSGQPETPVNNQNPSVTAPVRTADRGSAQTEPHDTIVAATSELPRPLQVCEFPSAGPETQHVAPTAALQSPTKGLLGKLRGMAISHSVGEPNGAQA